MTLVPTLPKTLYVSLTLLLTRTPTKECAIRPSNMHSCPVWSLVQHCQWLRPGSGHGPACGVTGENEVNVRYVLDKHPAVRLVAQTPCLAGPGVVGPCEPAPQAQQNGVRACRRATIVILSPYTASFLLIFTLPRPP